MQAEDERGEGEQEEAEEGEEEEDEVEEDEEVEWDVAGEGGVGMPANQRRGLTQEQADYLTLVMSKGSPSEVRSTRISRKFAPLG